MKLARTITRSSFKRKIVILGASIFTSLALMATGFATWIISTSSKVETDGNVTVGVTEEAAIEFGAIEFADDNSTIAFEPLAGDNVGRVLASSAVDALTENLTVSYSTAITGASNLNTLTVTVTIPKGVQDAVDAGYLNIVFANDVDWVKTPVLKTDTTDVIEAYNYTITKTGLKGVAEATTDTAFNYTPSGNNATLEGALSFTWGAMFGGMNPSVYYDTPDSDGVNGGKDVADDQVKVEIDTFRAMLGGLSYEQYKTQYLDTYNEETKTYSAADPVSSLKFHILIDASAS